MKPAVRPKSPPSKIDPKYILIAVSYVLPHLGGIEIVAEHQARHLARSGRDVHVLTSAFERPSGVSAEPEGHTMHRLRFWNITEDKFGAPFPLFAPSLWWHARKLVRQADVVHVHDAFYMTSFAAALWARLSGKPLVLTQHVAEIPHPKAVVRLGQKVVYATTGRFIFRTASRVAILNDNVRQFLLKHGVPDERIFVLPNGVDTSLFRPVKNQSEKSALRKKYRLPADKPLAIFIGRFVPKKGFDKLLQAGSEEYGIVFVGGEAPDAKTARDPHFIFMGGRPPAETAEICRACDIFVLPSEGEGFPLTVQEGMISRLPVITTDDPGYAVYGFKDEIVLIKPTVKNIRAALSELAADPKKRAILGSRAYDFAQKHFTWEQNIATLIDEYRKVAK